MCSSGVFILNISVPIVNPRKSFYNTRSSRMDDKDLEDLSSAYDAPRVWNELSPSKHYKRL